MTDNTDIVNRALQVIGTRTTVTAAELANETSNEAIQANLILEPYRDQLLRMAPWDCALRYDNLWYLTSAPGTPENTSSGTTLWQPGQPAPGWAYEYFYPPDCLRACYIIPANQTGVTNDIPITTAVTGDAPTFWNGPPVKFKTATDRFRAATAFTVITAGSGHAVGDVVTFGGEPSTAGEVPAGLVQITVATVNGSGGILTGTLASTPWVNKTGFFFQLPTYNLNQIDTTGFGTDAVIDVTAIGAATTVFDSRVILTNQQDATLAYVRQVTDPNVMDPLFQEAWIKLLGAGLQNALRDDKALANQLVTQVNNIIGEARKADGNEGLTINDVVPDWIRARGYNDAGFYNGPWSTFDWGPLWPTY